MQEGTNIVKEKEKKEAFQKTCYKKYVLNYALKQNPYAIFEEMLRFWQTDFAHMELTEYLQATGRIPGLKTMGEFLSEEYKDGASLYGILSPEEFAQWADLEHPKDDQNHPSMTYQQAKAIIETCIANGILQEESSIYVFAVRKDGSEASMLITKEEAIQDIMRNPDGQEVLLAELEEKGVEIPAGIRA